MPLALPAGIILLIHVVSLFNYRGCQGSRNPLSYMPDHLEPETGVGCSMER